MDADGSGLRYGSRGRRRRGLLLGAAAAVVIAVVVAMIVQFSPLGRGRSAGPGDSGYPKGPIRITGVGFFQQRGDGPPLMCIGAIGESLPAHCGTTVPVTGLDWDQVPDAVDHGGTIEGEAAVTGLWQDGVLAVESVERANHPERPASEPFVQLCDQPATTTGHTGAPDQGPDGAALEALDGFQASWVTHPDGRPTSETSAVITVFNIATTGDPAEAERVARRSFDGPLCVGTIPGPTDRELRAATERLRTRVAELGILSSTSGVTDGRTGISVGVFVATDAVIRQIHDVVGADMAPWTTVHGQFRQL